ncbi:MAG: AAA family ATPase [Bryobacteraceae bacterium]
MAESLPGRNPFEFGGELKPSSLIDREEELDAVVRTLEQGGALFLIGPRRYGKTSILAAAEQRLGDSSVVVLRHDAEVYESLGTLAEALLAAAAKRLTGSLEMAGAAVKRFAARLRPEVSYDLPEQSIAIRFGLPERAETAALPVLTDVLNIVDRLARDNGRRAAIILDEFQQVVLEGGAAAERRIRGTIQRHHHTSYVFAGSKTRLLADMTNDPGRAFWKLGTRLFLGAIPRPIWIGFLERGFSSAGFGAQSAALSRLLDLAEDVPYNIQQLANLCWEQQRGSGGGTLTAARVGEALARLIARENAAYTQIWNSMSRTQKVVLKAVITESGRNLRAQPVLARYGIAASTMHKTLKALDDRGLVREEEALGSIHYRLEDPFLGHWLRIVQVW